MPGSPACTWRSGRCPGWWPSRSGSASTSPPRAPAWREPRWRSPSRPRGAGAAPAAPSSSLTPRSCCAPAAARTSPCSAAKNSRSSRSRWREMCATCGCAGDEPAGHVHEDGTWHRDGTGHEHDHGQHADARTVTLAEKVLARNDALARQNRDWLRERGILALNLMSSPGAGKTTLLERTAADLTGEFVVGVIEGDQETALDADRMRAAGCQLVQINTGTGWHLDA